MIHYSEEDYKEKLVYILDNFEVKTCSQMAQELGVRDGAIHSWIKQMRQGGIPLPKATKSTLKRVIKMLAEDPVVIKTVERMNNKEQK